MKPFIYSYNIVSESAKALAESLNCKRIKLEGGRYRYKDNDLIINLGNSSVPAWARNNTKWINHPSKVAIAVCKKKTFEKLKEDKVSIPDFTTDINVARGWIRDEFKVACRAVLNGHSAQGLTIASKENELLANTRLFVKYFPKKHEYRVHLIRKNGELVIFDFVQKKKRAEISNDDMNYQIRNHGQWVFARENVVLPNCVKTQAIKAGNSLGLDLFSVDICYSEKNDKCVVLELNTCSGMCETTVANYTRELLTVINGNVAANPAPRPLQPLPIEIAPAPAPRPRNIRQEVIDLLPIQNGDNVEASNCYVCIKDGQIKIYGRGGILLNSNADNFNYAIR